MTTTTDLIRSRARTDAVVKVTGEARYAYEYPIEGTTYAFIVQSTVAKGRIVRIDASAARALPGVVDVITYENAPRLQSPAGDSAIMQSDRVSYVGQIVAAVVAETLEVARHGARLVQIDYADEPHDVELSVDRPDLYVPEHLNGGYEPETFKGDVEAGLAFAPVTHEATYETPTLHNNPMEMHSTIAVWRDDGVTLYDSNQSTSVVAKAIGDLFALPPEQVHVIAPYVGGGFGSKPKPNLRILAVMASRVVGRPVKAILTRQQMFSLAGHRTPTHQRVTLGVEANGKLISIAHDTIEQSAAIEEFAEQTGVATRVMYGAPNLRTTHRLAVCDIPAPSWMRAPGECPGMFALESAIDEAAIACGIDPVEFRITNEPSTRPEDDKPFSSRGLVECLREGARRIRWDERVAAPRSRRDGRWLIGLGVASSLYPVYRMPGSAARITATPDGRFRVEIGAADIGQGAWTVLQVVAAEALAVDLDAVDMAIGDSLLPPGTIAGGSSGTTSWGSAIVEAARQLRRRLDEHGGGVPAGGVSVRADAPENAEEDDFAMYAFGAQFAEARVDMDTGEVRVPRMCGMFGAGRILSPTQARSQFIGGMTMGLSMALHEHTVIDTRFGDYATHDLAEYHIATNADVGEIDVGWIDEHDPHVNAMGSKGIGEIGIVGTAAAIANAVHNATGIRVRDLPITLDKLLSA